MDVDRWVFVEVGNSAAFPPIASIFFFFFRGNRKQSLSAESESRA